MHYIHVVCKLGDVTNLIKLIDQGGNINQKDQQELAPIHHAAYYNQIEILKVLSQHADFLVDILDGDNLTSLHIAVYYGHKEFVQELIKLNANVNYLNQYKMNVLHVAINNLVDIEIIEMLINANVDINARDSKGRTPLHMAVVKQNVQIIKLLLDNNVDNNIKDNSARLAIDLSYDGEIKELLTNYLHLDDIKYVDV